MSNSNKTMAPYNCRVLVKVLLANTVEHAKHFTKQTTTVVFAGKTTLGKTVICVSDNYSFLHCPTV